ncbi:MAG: oxidoreductase [Gracilibacter sp. BRH_c7a]|nr:MAG: oxidoreductase [Gracilibacter sp. BRH_c7a]
MYDITIVGAGPAGATLARLLGNEYKILLLDRRRLDIPLDSFNGAGIEKCCGGLIAPDAQNMLARMGLGVPREVLVGPQLFTVRTIDIQNKMERYYQRHYINIDREKFDRWLFSMIPSHVDTLCGVSFKTFEERSDSLRLKYKLNDKTYEADTKYLIGADGASSIIRRRYFPNNQIQKYISIQEWFKTNKRIAYYSAIFDSEITDFYSWTIPKEDYLILGSALLPNDNPNERFELLKQKLKGYDFDIGECVKRNGAYILRPDRTKHIFLGNGRVALIGEAAGWISPTSAEGLSYAFRSATALAHSMKASPQNIIEHYYNKTKSLRLNILSKNLKAPFMYNKNIRRNVLQSGLLSMDIYK